MRKRKPAPKLPAPRPQPTPRPVPRPKPSPSQEIQPVRRNPSDLLNPDLIKRARDEYSASLPEYTAYSATMTPTKYGGMFGSSAGRGFDAWFEKNYINNPNSPLSDQERMSLQQFVGVPSYAMDMAGQRDFNYDSAMARQMYQNLLDYQAQNYAAMQASQPSGFGSVASQLQAGNMLPYQNQQQNVPSLMPIQTPQSAAANQALSQAGLGGGIPSPVQQGTAQQQQAMQNYQNFLSQGAASYQAAMQQPISPAMPKPLPAPKKPSTPSFRTPRPLG